MKKLMLIMIIGMMLISLGSAAIGNLGIFEQGKEIELRQTSIVYDYCNITSVYYPDLSNALGEVSMEKDGYEFSYEFNKTDKLGQYKVNGFCMVETDDGETKETFNYVFEVTKTGEEEFDSTYAIIILLISFGTAFTGFFGKNIWVTVIGGIIMIFFGIYTMTNGIVGFNNQLTEVISIISIGLGFFFTLYPLIEWIEDMF